jgi:ABC-2 type transport system permease protein
MKQTLLFFRYEALGFVRSRLFLGAVGLLLVVGLYAIHYGKTEMTRQAEVLQEIRKDEATKADAMRSYITTDTLPNVIGGRAYRLVENPPSAWASLSIGQRDIFPYYLYIRYWSLARQLLTTEIANPEKQLTGNFDLAFVFIYLLPLFIIAISYNVLSGEREAGTLPLLLSNPVSERRVTYLKIAFRALIALGLVLILVVAALIICSIRLDLQVAQWLLATILYGAFWFGVVLVVNNQRKSSAHNAFSLLGVWIVVVVILPALVNLYLASAYAPPPRNDLTQAVRHEYEEIWTHYDDAKYRLASLQKLASRHNGYEPDTSRNGDVKYVLAEYEFYDERLTPVFDKYTQLASRRQQIAETVGAISVAATAQNYYNSLANTDLAAHVSFMDSVKEFHATLKDYFYTMVFTNTTFRTADFETIPVYKPELNTAGSANNQMLLILLIQAVAVWALGIFWKS